MLFLGNLLIIMKPLTGIYGKKKAIENSRIYSKTGFDCSRATGRISISP